MDQHDRALIDFLAGDLDEPAARAFDEHLLDCDHCWDAVREDRAGRTAAARLRESAPPELAERIRFSIELAAVPRPRRRRSWGWVLGAGGAVVGAVVAVLVMVLPSTPPAADPPAIAAVVHAAQTPPAPSAAPDVPAADPAPVSVPAEVVADGAHLRLRYYRIDGGDAVVATSDRPFPTPADARTVMSGGMAWTAERAGVALYCPNAEVVIAAPVPANELPGLAYRLPLH